MNILILIVQTLLALYTLTGAIYMMNNFVSLANEWAYTSLPQPFWIVLGGLQVILAVALIVSGLIKKPKVGAYAAFGLAALSLLGVVLFSAYAGFPGMLWGLIPALLYAGIGYKYLSVKK